MRAFGRTATGDGRPPRPRLNGDEGGIRGRKAGCTAESVRPAWELPRIGLLGLLEKWENYWRSAGGVNRLRVSGFVTRS
jgi:hypothetical protein